MRPVELGSFPKRAMQQVLETRAAHPLAPPPQRKLHSVRHIWCLRWRQRRTSKNAWPLCVLWPVGEQRRNAGLCLWGQALFRSCCVGFPPRFWQMQLQLHCYTATRVFLLFWDLDSFWWLTTDEAILFQVAWQLCSGEKWCHAEAAGSAGQWSETASGRWDTSTGSWRVLLETFLLLRVPWSIRRWKSRRSSAWEWPRDLGHVWSDLEKVHEPRWTRSKYIRTRRSNILRFTRPPRMGGDSFILPFSTTI